MPLQYMAPADATQRIYRHAQSGRPGSAELLGTPVGQVVGQMNAQESVRSVIEEMVSEYVDTISRVHARLEKADLS